MPLLVIFRIGIRQQLFLGRPWGDNPVSDTGLVLTALFIFIVMTGVTWLAFTMRLVTEVTPEGFKSRFPPLMNKFRTIPESMIGEYQVRKYNPIGDYGGWGIRTGMFGKGRAYNVKGNMGVQLKLHNNKRILFGTQRLEALKAAMDKMMNPPEF